MSTRCFASSDHGFASRCQSYQALRRADVQDVCVLSAVTVQSERTSESLSHLRLLPLLHKKLLPLLPRYMNSFVHAVAQRDRFQTLRDLIDVRHSIQGGLRGSWSTSQGRQMDRGEVEVEEEGQARVKSAPVLPTDNEREEHEVTHATFSRLVRGVWQDVRRTIPTNVQRMNRRSRSYTSACVTRCVSCILPCLARERRVGKTSEGSQVER